MIDCPFRSVRLDTESILRDCLFMSVEMHAIIPNLFSLPLQDIRILIADFTTRKKSRLKDLQISHTLIGFSPAQSDWFLAFCLLIKGHK
jgi:hypothetical protein